MTKLNADLPKDMQIQKRIIHLALPTTVENILKRQLALLIH